jgi:hypothetical protein
MVRRGQAVLWSLRATRRSVIRLATRRAWPAVRTSLGFALSGRRCASVWTVPRNVLRNAKHILSHFFGGVLLGVAALAVYQADYFRLNVTRAAPHSRATTVPCRSPPELSRFTRFQATADTRPRLPWRHRPAQRQPRQRPQPSATRHLPWQRPTQEERPRAAAPRTWCLWTAATAPTWITSAYAPPARWVAPSTPARPTAVVR